MRTLRLPFINYPDVGKNLRTLLEEKNLSQQEIATKAGISQGNLSRFISKGIGLGPEKILVIAEVLEVDVRTLYGIPPS